MAIAALMGVGTAVKGDEAPSLELNFDGTASSFTRATTSPTAAKANGDQLATDIVTQNKSDTVQSKYMGPNGKLISGYRRNYAPHSTTFTSAAGWSGNLPSVTSGQADPFGGTDASVLLDNTNLYMFLEATQTFTSSNDYWCTSIFVKKNSGSTPAGQPDNSLHCLLRIIAGPQGANAGTYHDLTLNPNTGSFSASTSETGAIASVEDLGGWYRMSIAGKHSGNTTEATFQFFPDVGGAYVTGGTGYSASAQGSVIAFGAQFERGEAAAQSYRAAPDSGAQVPRVEFDSSGSALGLLVEEERANLVTQSAPATGGNVITTRASFTTPGSVVAPDGSAAIKAVEDSTAATTHEFGTNAIGMAASTTYTLSVYAKAAERSFTILNIYSGTTSYWTWFDLTNGTVGTVTNSPVGYSISDAGGGWYRCSLTVTTASSGTPNTRVYISPANNSLTYNGDGSSGIYVYGAQLEAGEGPTSYIPTSGASAARPADDITLATSAFGYNTAANTVLADFTTRESSLSVNAVYRFDDGSNNNNDIIYYNTGAAKLVRQTKDGGTSTVYDMETALSPPFSRTIAARNDGTAARDAIDGTLGSLQTIVAPSTLRTTLYIGRSNLGNMNGHIRRFTYWPRAINDAQLSKFTNQ